MTYMSLSLVAYLGAPPAVQTVLLNAYALWIDRHRYGPRLRATLEELRSRERWDRERLRNLQGERLRAIVGHAYRHSRYYRGLLDERGITPDDVGGVDDLSRLPLLTRDVVRAQAPDLMTRPRPGRGWLHGHTSGTTGSPLSLWYDRQTCVMNNAVDRRQKRWAGMPDDGWIGLLLGRVVLAPARKRAPYWRVNYVHRQVWFSSFHLSDETLPSYVAEMKRRGLRYLEGYPSTLYVIARYLERHGQQLPLSAAFTSSETLLPVQRETIEQAFGCRLFDFYGLAERVIFAGECEEHAGKHISEDYGIVEVVDDAGQPVPEGTPGYLVGTSLHNTAMPMVRYRTSDVSAIIPEQCACGRTFRRLRDVTTKAEDFVVTPGGRLISPSILTHPFKPLTGIRESQIVQDRPDHLLIRLVPAPDYDANEEHRLLTALRERLGSEMQLTIQLVSEVPRAPSGKFRWVVSEIQHAYKLRWDRQDLG
jgi:phenylacetate-CoA ligase